jgi:hypothetical protein
VVLLLLQVQLLCRAVCLPSRHSSSRLIVRLARQNLHSFRRLLHSHHVALIPKSCQCKSTQNESLAPGKLHLFTHNLKKSTGQRTPKVTVQPQQLLDVPDHPFHAFLKAFARLGRARLRHESHAGCRVKHAHDLAAIPESVHFCP